MEQRALVEGSPVHGRAWNKMGFRVPSKPFIAGFQDNESSWRSRRRGRGCSCLRAHVLLRDGCLLCTNPGAEINCSYTMKRHFIAEALGKANVIRTDIEYKSLAVTHPAITLCSAACHQSQALGKNKKGTAFSLSLGKTAAMTAKSPNHCLN